MFRFHAAIGAVIPQQQVAILFGKPFDTTLEATIFQLDTIWIRRWRRHGLREFLPQVLKVDLVRDAEEIACAVAAELFFDLFELAGNAVDCFVSEVFGFDAAAPGEDLDEATADLLVLQCGLFAIGIKPIEQRIKSFL